MIRLTLLAGLLLAAAVHIVTILMVPRLAPQDAYRRFAGLGPDFRFDLLGTPTPESAPLPGLDPAMRFAICRYDLSARPLEIHVGLEADYWALSLHDRRGQSFYVVNNRSADRDRLEVLLATPRQAAEIRRVLPENQLGRLLVEAPDVEGFAVVRALVALPSEAESIEAKLRQATCAPRG
jgi:uncharacterized membrane protein